MTAPTWIGGGNNEASNPDGGPTTDIHALFVNTLGLSGTDFQGGGPHAVAPLIDIAKADMRKDLLPIAGRVVHTLHPIDSTALHAGSDMLRADYIYHLLPYIET
jgi:hypothetical protein